MEICRGNLFVGDFVSLRLHKGVATDVLRATHADISIVGCCKVESLSLVAAAGWELAAGRGN